MPSRNQARSDLTPPRIGLDCDTASTDAVIALLDAMLAMRSVGLVIRRATLTGERAGPERLADMRAATSSSDPASRAAQRERARTERHRLDSTHPTTASRIAVSEQRQAERRPSCSTRPPRAPCRTNSAA